MIADAFYLIFLNLTDYDDALEIKFAKPLLTHFGDLISRFLDVYSIYENDINSNYFKNDLHLFEGYLNKELGLLYVCPTELNDWIELLF